MIFCATLKSFSLYWNTCQRSAKASKYRQWHINNLGINPSERIDNTCVRKLLKKSEDGWTHLESDYSRVEHDWTQVNTNEQKLKMSEHKKNMSEG